VPCPHLSRESGECLLVEDVPEDEEGLAETPLEEPVKREWCLSPGKAYRECPVFRKFLLELLS